MKRLDLWKFRENLLKIKCLESLKSEKTLRNGITAFFEFQTTCFAVRLRWCNMRPSPSAHNYISKYVSYDNPKFGDDPSTLAEEDACGVMQSSPKREFSTNNSHFTVPI